MLFIPKRSSANFYVNELIYSHKQGKASFRNMLNNYSDDQMKDIRHAITKQVDRLSASIKKGPKSKERADKFLKLLMLKRIRTKIEDKLEEKDNGKESIVIDI